MTLLKKHGFSIALAFAVVGFVAFNGVGFFGKTASESKYVYEGQPEIIAATFSSAWCSACKILEPKLAQVAPEFSDKPVKFVKLDFSLGQGKGPADIADENNFSSVYEAHKGGTGYTLLLDAETGEIIDKLTVRLSADEMKQVLIKAIKQVS